MYKDIIDQNSFRSRVSEAQSRFSDYKVPTTKEEYWATIDKYWPDLLAIILQFAPEFIESERTSVVATRLKEAKDVNLVEFFHKTWASAPDTGSIHLIPGWPILCDLCSESYLIAYE